jgi:hypothetical protein
VDELIAIDGTPDILIEKWKVFQELIQNDLLVFIIIIIIQSLMITCILNVNVKTRLILIQQNRCVLQVHLQI